MFPDEPVVGKYIRCQLLGASTRRMSVLQPEVCRSHTTAPKVDSEGTTQQAPISKRELMNLLYSGAGRDKAYFE